MNRRLFTLAAAMSMLSLIATVAAWVSSRFIPFGFYRYCDGVTSDLHFSLEQTFCCDAGCLEWQSDRMQVKGFGGQEFLEAWRRSRAYLGFKDHEFWSGHNHVFYFPGTLDRVIGFGYRARPVAPSSGSPVAVTGVAIEASVPFWSIALVSAVLPTAWLNRARCDRRRKRAGLCPRCGYDLRATPDRCPECGTVIMRNRA